MLYSSSTSAACQQLVSLCFALPCTRDRSPTTCSAQSNEPPRRAQRTASGNGITLFARQRTLRTPQQLESLNSMDLDDLEIPVEPCSVQDASKKAQIIDKNDTQVAKTLLVGKLAILGLGAVLLAERATGKSVVQYITDSDMLMPSMPTAQPVLAVLICALSVAAVVGTRQQLRGAMERVQAWAGRAACISLAGVLTSEMLTGEAVLELLNVQTGVAGGVSEPEAIGAFLLMLLLTGGRTKSSSTMP